MKKPISLLLAVLTAAALTYVAAALTSIIQLLYLMARYNRNSNR